MAVDCGKVFLLVFAATLLLALTAAASYEVDESGLKVEPYASPEKKSANLGSRWDSRNCGTYNKLRKKSDKWFSLDDLKQRRLDFYLANLLREKGYPNNLVPAPDADDYKTYK